MYVCVCKAVTDSQLRNAINNGICTRQQLVHCFGVGKDCGKCNKEVKELLAHCNEQNAVYSMQLAANH